MATHRADRVATVPDLEDVAWFYTACGEVWASSDAKGYRERLRAVDAPFPVNCRRCLRVLASRGEVQP